MKRLSFLFIALVGLAVMSCSTEAAEKVADEFHAKLDQGDHEYIINNLADLSEVTKDDWYGFLDVVKGWGPQSNRTKESNFEKRLDNGITRVRLSYTFDVAKYGKIYERIVLVESEGDYKIKTVVMNSDESVVIEGTKDF